MRTLLFDWQLWKAPHSIACAALLPERVIAAAAIASPAPIDAEGLDWTAGMGHENVAELAAARAGDREFEEYLGRQAQSMVGSAPSASFGTSRERLKLPCCICPPSNRSWRATPHRAPFSGGNSIRSAGDLADSVRYSVVENSQIAMPSMTRPSTTIIPASSSAGTCQPNQVTPGSSAARAAGEIVRWLNTRRRIGSTA